MQREVSIEEGTSLTEKSAQVLADSGIRFIFAFGPREATKWHVILRPFQQPGLSTQSNPCISLHSVHQLGSQLTGVLEFESGSQSALRR